MRHANLWRGRFVLYASCVGSGIASFSRENLEHGNYVGDVQDRPRDTKGDSVEMTDDPLPLSFPPSQ